jgi:methylphosphotriester-DNA--protein-cysteine methyltransferase
VPNENASTDATRVAVLIDRIEAHDAEGLDIRAAADALGLDAARIKSIRKARADLAATQKTLAALMGAGMLPEGAKL